MHPFIEHFLLLTHLISGATWLGALVYRTFFVDPKAKKFFKKESDFEHFSLYLADGMRYVVVLALFSCGFSGFILVGLRWDANQTWLSLIATKTALWTLSLCLFGYITWRFWPSRVFASGIELQQLRRQGFLIACTMITIAASGMVLGYWAQVERLDAQTSNRPQK